MNPPAPTTTPAATPALDPTIVNLAKAIRETETRGQKDPYTAKGASGEFGAYQYTEGTWAKDVKAFTGKDVPLAQADKLIQNEVAYKKLESLKKQGYNVGQIASIWNSGSPDWEGKVGVNGKGVKYNVPQYVDSVAKSYQALKAGQTPNYEDTSSTVGKEQIVTPEQQADDESANASGAVFKAKTGEGIGAAALKTAGNMIPSAFNFIKGALNTINPLEIMKTIGQIPGAFNEAVTANGGSVGAALGETAKALPGEAYKAVVPLAARDVIAGDFEGAQREVTNNPFGSIAPLVFGAKGAAEGVDTVTRNAAKAKMADYVNNIGEKTAKGEPIPTATGTNFGQKVDSTITKIASPITKPTSYVFGKAADMAGATTKYGTAKLTGFNPETIDAIKANPEAFTPEAMSSATRGSLGHEVASKLNERIDAKEETGVGYNAVRSIKKPVKVDPTFLEDTLKKSTGLELKKGQFKATAKSAVDSPTDIAKVQRLYDAWKPYFKKGAITADDFITLRSKLAKIANYEGVGKSAPLENAASSIRTALNNKYRAQIEGLEGLDADFTSQSAELKALRKGFIDKDGNLTDTALNKIANAGGKGKDAQLARLEEISPGITHRIRVLKAIEDVQNIHKVGTYTKGVIEGGGLVGGLATMNLPLVAGSIASLLLSQPEIAVRMIRGYGKYAEPLAKKVLEIVKKGGGAVNSLPESKATQVSVFGAKQPQLTQ